MITNKEKKPNTLHTHNDVLQSHLSLVKESSLFKEQYKDVNDIIDVPILYKSKLRELLESRFNIQAENKGVYLVRSGGSMQKPLIFPVDIKENLYQRRLLSKELESFGMLTSETIALNIFSYQDMYRTAAIMDDLLDRCYATTLALGCNSAYSDMYHTANNFKPNTLMGTPSKIGLFAKYIEQNNLEVAIDNLLFAGEFLFSSQIEQFKNIFKTKCIYSLYGSAETGIWGWTNYSENGSSFFILDEIIVEIVDADSNGFGAIVVTNLIRKRFPLIRYAMGDIGKLETIYGKRVLTLKSRESSSFLLYADTYFLDDFDFIKKYADRFQIQIAPLSLVQTEVMFLIILKKDNQKQTDTILCSIKTDIEEVVSINPKIISLKVQIASESDLYADATTSKTPSIVDFRN
jgi:phenylacetate-CoA ligase